MSYVFNMIYGSAGGGSGPSASDAILTVTVPTGFSVSATKGAVTLTPTIWTTAADSSFECALFVIPASKFDANTPWTVTATSGSISASKTVTISTNKSYELSIDILVFIADGVQIVPRDTSGQSYPAIVTEQGDILSVQFTGGAASANATWKITDQLLSGKQYTSLIFDIQSWNGVLNNQYAAVGVASSVNTLNYQVVYESPYGVTFPGKITVDCSNTTLSNRWVFVRVAETGGTEAIIKNVYMVM